MVGVVVALLLAFGTLTMIWLVLGRRAAPAPKRLPGELTAAERKRLYRRLGLDPRALARQGRIDLLLSTPDPHEPRRR